MIGPSPSWRTDMERLYDVYFASRDYEQRYPRPNAGTLDFLWRHGVALARHVVDVGCGNGRYAMPVLGRSRARMVCCDISRGAINALELKLRGSTVRDRVTLVVGGAEDLAPEARFDRLLLLFGVLSHVGPRAARVDMLRQLRQRCVPDARLLLSVPSFWRRRPRELLGSLLALARGRGEGLGDVRFTRKVAGRPQTFYYHLYTVAGLREELAQGGWQLHAPEAESLLPEWLVTQSRIAARFDQMLQKMCPAALGYGIRAWATPLDPRTDEAT
ncbi:MAG TPA: class I SAM-dependent methyltransferase [Ramlibacter sp.]|nr:class I SAM-dependent methyltransferase [Ramlibacter sp.]